MPANRCPKCQAEIPEGAAEGLCPQCLLHGAMKPESSQTAAYSPGRFDFEPPTPQALQASFPQLEILELLGKGGMGAVYKARQPVLDRLVAVKILPPELGRDPAFVERFLREARALAKLNHPNIIGVYDFGQAGGYCYFVMEYMDGVNLRQAIRTGELKPAETLKIVPQVCDALQFAHDEGVVHRDIKPENILLDKRGRVKIADFGLAKLLGKAAPDLSLTATQQVMGSLRYMAPEQMAGSRDIDHRADIYSLGVTFYEMLTGEVPMGRFAPPSQKVQIDVRLDEVVLRSLEREPERRYQQASDVRTKVEEIVKGVPTPSSAPQPSMETKLEAPAIIRKTADLLFIWMVISALTAFCMIVWMLMLKSGGMMETGSYSQPALIETKWSSPQNMQNSPMTGMKGSIYYESPPPSEPTKVVLWLILMSLFIFTFMIGLTAALLRQKRFWTFVLILAISLLSPAVLSFFIILEFGWSRSWNPGFFGFWIGVPLSIWTIILLFRDDVREAFARRKAQPRSRRTFNALLWLRIATILIALVGALLVLGWWGHLYIYGSAPHKLSSVFVYDAGYQTISGLVTGGLFLAVCFLILAAIRKRSPIVPAVTAAAGIAIIIAVTLYVRNPPLENHPAVVKFARAVLDYCQQIPNLPPQEAFRLFGAGTWNGPTQVEASSNLKMLEYAERTFKVEFHYQVEPNAYICGVLAIIMVLCGILDWHILSRRTQAEAAA